MELTRHGEAAETFRAGAVLEPTSKLWTPLVKKAEKAASEAPAPAPAAAKPANGASSVRSAASPPKTTTTTTTKAVAPKTAAASGATGAGAGAGGSSSTGGEAGSGMKGYKKTADGRVTTYFNNDLTEEAKALIGDIAPKKLEPAAAAAAPGAGGNAASAWNKAGTWESRDMTRFASVCACACFFALASTAYAAS